MVTKRSKILFVYLNKYEDNHNILAIEHGRDTDSNKSSDFLLNPVCIMLIYIINNDIQLQEQNMRLKNLKKLNILMKLYRAGPAGIRPYYVDILKTKMKEPCLVNYV